MDLNNINKDKVLEVFSKLEHLKEEKDKEDLINTLNKEEKIILLKTMEIVNKLGITGKFVLEGLTGLEINTKLDLTKYLLQNCDLKKILEASMVKEIESVFKGILNDRQK